MEKIVIKEKCVVERRDGKDGRSGMGGTRDKVKRKGKEKGKGIYNNNNDPLS